MIFLVLNFFQLTFLHLSVGSRTDVSGGSGKAKC